MKTAQMSDYLSRIKFFLIAAVIGIASFLLPNQVSAVAQFHGATIQKSCVGPSGSPVAREGETVDCTIKVTNADDFGDALTINSISDVVHHQSGDVATGNLLAAPVVLAAKGDFVEKTHSYTVEVGDKDPLRDDASTQGTDPEVGNFELSFPGAVDIIHPHTTLTKTADPKSGSAPLNVTYTYKETNDGNDPISNVVLTDDKCAPVIYQSGDTNTNNILDPGETWIFTCKTTLNETTTNIVVATGTASDGKSAPEERAQATVEVVQGCTLTQGFWKNHPSAWPVNSLTLGTVNYTKAQLLSNLKTPVKGNGLISLAHQLIAAKLNIASGASSSSIASTIASADALIGGKVVPPVGSGFLSPSSTSSLAGTLDNYNSGLIGPGHCAD